MLIFWLLAPAFVALHITYFRQYGDNARIATPEAMSDTLDWERPDRRPEPPD